MLGGELLIERSELRDTLPGPAGLYGRGVSVLQEQDVGSSTARVVQSLLANNFEVAAVVFGSSLSIEHTVIRDTQPRAVDLDFGRGVSAQSGSVLGGPAQLTVSESVITRNRDTGVFVYDSSATLDSVVISDVLPRAVDGLYGDGAIGWSQTLPMDFDDPAQPGRPQRARRHGDLCRAPRARHHQAHLQLHRSRR